MTFSFAGYRDPAWTNFGPLRVMVENHIQPHSGFPAHPHNDVEILTYVAAGTLTHGDSFGHRAAITAGEMQHISAGADGMVHSEENLHDIVEHNYQMWLIPDREGTKFAYHQLKFTQREREGLFRLYASADGRDGSMQMNADADVYGALFRAGDVVTHELAEGRGAWVQIVRGRLRVAGLPLASGDGIGITSADRVRIECEEKAEVLLFDVRMDATLIWR